MLQNMVILCGFFAEILQIFSRFAFGGMADLFVLDCGGN